MDARHLISLALLVLAGCQSGGNTALMERELRLQEDRIYYLEDELARCCEAMQSLQSQTATAPAAATAAPLPSRRGEATPSEVPSELPKVELELPQEPEAPSTPLPVPGPAPNGLPHLFEPQRIEAEPQGTAMRIVRPDNAITIASPTEPAATASNSPRMRFASAVSDPVNQSRASRTVVEWSAAQPPATEPAAADTRETVTIGAAPRRPQWSPYR